MPRKQRLIVREAPHRALERIRAAVNGGLETEQDVLPKIEVAGEKFYGWVPSRGFGLSVRRDVRNTRMRLNSWDPWLIGKVDTTAEGTVISYKVGVSPGMELWWRAVYGFLGLMWLLPLGLTIWGDAPVPVSAWLAVTLGPVLFIAAVKVIERIALTENRVMWEELRNFLPELFKDVTVRPIGRSYRRV